jgi:type I restriction enzyme M protein
MDRITDILRRDDGISGAMHYTEQISWILFLNAAAYRLCRN